MGNGDRRLSISSPIEARRTLKTRDSMKTKLLRPALLISLLMTSACGPTLESMHTLAKTGAVEEGAPIHARHEIVVNAPIEKVWAYLTDVASWPKWNPTVRSAVPPASLSEGATFGWDNHGTDIHAQVARLEGHVFAWTDRGSIAKAIHVWRLFEVAPASTRVEAEESMDGFMVSTFYGQYELDQTLDAWLTSLKKVAEGKSVPDARDTDAPGNATRCP
jgi:uncharacterized protein YndB with AHSA1/START domain